MFLLKDQGGGNQGPEKPPAGHQGVLLGGAGWGLTSWSAWEPLLQRMGHCSLLAPAVLSELSLLLY